MADTLFVTYTERVGKGENAQTLTTTQEVPKALGHKLLDADNARHREATEDEIEEYKAALKSRRDRKLKNVQARAAKVDANQQATDEDKAAAKQAAKPNAAPKKKAAAKPKAKAKDASEPTI